MGLCDDCGAEYQGSPKFCGACGKTLDAAAQEAKSPAGGAIKVAGEDNCHLCGKGVGRLEALKSSKYTFHLPCFKCIDCGVQLSQASHKGISGEIFCGKCYTAENGKPIHLRRKFGGPSAPLNANPKPAPAAAAALGGGGDSCHVCKGTVYPLEKVRSSTAIYHKECFKCYDCKLQLTALTYMGVEGEAFCKACHQAEMGKLPQERRTFGNAAAPLPKSNAPAFVPPKGEHVCPTCNKQVYDAEKLVAADRWYHNSGCFVCNTCKVKLSLANYKAVAGDPFCMGCFEKKMIDNRPQGYQEEFKGYYNQGKGEKLALEDTNVAGLGGAENRSLRKAAAQTEAAWSDAGKEVGIQIWRIEKFKVVGWPRDSYGNFYRGDAYIVLHTYREPEGPKLLYDVFFWLGSTCSQDEQGTAAYKTVELDDLLGDLPVQHRETEGNESEKFLDLFGGKIFIMEGGVESGFNRVKPEEYKARLLHIKGKANKVRVEQVELKTAALNEGDVFLLDNGLTIYEWQGKSSAVAERNKARDLRIGLQDQRNGKAKAFVIDQNDKDSVGAHVPAFYELIGGRGAISPATPDEQVVAFEKVLLRLSDESGALEITEVARGKAVHRGLLKPEDVYILDAGYTVFAWIGAATTKNERSKGIPFAVEYMQKHNRPSCTPVLRVLEGASQKEINKAFDAD